MGIGDGEGLEQRMFTHIKEHVDAASKELAHERGHVWMLPNAAQMSVFPIRRRSHRRPQSQSFAAVQAPASNLLPETALPIKHCPVRSMSAIGI